jgi:hypothetical protein
VELKIFYEGEDENVHGHETYTNKQRGPSMNLSTAGIRAAFKVPQMSVQEFVTGARGFRDKEKIKLAAP